MSILGVHEVADDPSFHDIALQPDGEILDGQENDDGELKIDLSPETAVAVDEELGLRRFQTHRKIFPENAELHDPAADRYVKFLDGETSGYTFEDEKA